MSTAHPLAQLAMWNTWQDKVREALPNFAADRIYVEQNSPSQAEFEEVARWVERRGMIDLHGRTRDEQYGARVVRTQPFGAITRMWLDSNVEYHFLCEALGMSKCWTGPFNADSGAKRLGDMNVLEIGAGYGRLAVPLAPLVRNYSCVDAVPISTKLCLDYVDEHGAPNIYVYVLDHFVKTRKHMHVDLAINIHSWNECSLEQIANWLAVLKEMDVRYLFTVSHGQLETVPEAKRVQRAYYSWGNGQPSFRPLLEADYDLVAEESIGLGLHPHALWRRR